MSTHPVVETPWRRLSPRMLLIHPVKAIQGLLPLLIVVVLTRDGDGFSPGQAISGVVAGVLALVFSVGAWFTTRFRVDERTLQRQSGLLSRNTVTVALDRIRGVDVEAGPLMRLLGLATVRIGTGVDDTRIELEGLPRAEAEAMRAALLHRARVLRAAAAPTQSPDGVGAADPAAPLGTAGPGLPAEPDAHPGADADADLAGSLDEGTETELARFDPSWLRFAPFGFSGLVITAAATGFLSQFGEDLVDVPVVRHAWSGLQGLELSTLIGWAVGLGLVLWLLTSTATYVLGWWGMRLTRHSAGTLHLTRGLLTRHALSLEEGKVRGVLMDEPLHLRWLRAADLSIISTGVEDGTTPVLPVAPRTEAQRLGGEILSSTHELDMALQGHGPLARRRQYTGVLRGTLISTAVVLALWLLVPWGSFLPFEVPWWVPVGLLALNLVTDLWLAEETWRNLAHGLTPRHLVVQSGALRRRRVALERDGIIGWNLEQSWFQRRLGLATLTATTAAGDEHYDIVDVPLERATALAHAATPGILTPFSR